VAAWQDFIKYARRRVSVTARRDSIDLARIEASPGYRNHDRLSHGYACFYHESKRREGSVWFGESKANAGIMDWSRRQMLCIPDGRYDGREKKFLAGVRLLLRQPRKTALSPETRNPYLVPRFSIGRTTSPCPGNLQTWSGYGDPRPTRSSISSID